MLCVCADGFVARPHQHQYSIIFLIGKLIKGIKFCLHSIHVSLLVVGVCLAARPPARNTQQRQWWLMVPQRFFWETPTWAKKNSPRFHATQIATL
jgi:hypothetical protein